MQGQKERKRARKTCGVELWKQSCRVAVLREVVYAMRCPTSKEEQSEGSGSPRIWSGGVTVCTTSAHQGGAEETENEELSQCIRTLKNTGTDIASGTLQCPTLVEGEQAVFTLFEAQSRTQAVEGGRAKGFPDEWFRV